jgi:hypothetical protein
MNDQGTQTATRKTIDSTVETETRTRNVFQLLAICVTSIAFATASIASAQTYQSIDFPGATTTILDGGPNPQGTSVGTYTDTAGVTHGFVLTKKGIFTFQFRRFWQSHRWFCLFKIGKISAIFHNK